MTREEISTPVAPQLRRSLSRRVSTMELADAEEENVAANKRSPSLGSRQVSDEGLGSVPIVENDSEVAKGASSTGRGSPARCVSEFDKVASLNPSNDQDDSMAEDFPPFPNPLCNPKVLDLHTEAVRLEANLLPMRLILSRLMAHPTLNRRGLFNVPVDPVALRLPDYFDIVKNPMDLGSIKTKLHAVAYRCRRDVADDIRLVFENAMQYNPAKNTVHIAAKQLLVFFEDQVEAFVPELLQASQESSCVDGDGDSMGDSIARTVSHEADSAEPAKSPTADYSAEPAKSPTTDSKPPASQSSSTVNNQATRKRSSPDMLAPATTLAGRKRKKRGSKVNLSHTCDRCEGRRCGVCDQGCLHLEPTLLICNGPHCAGSKIRKGAVYYIAEDGARQFCQRCYTGLPAVLPSSGQDDGVRYKRNLLKRKNDEEIVEDWVSCVKCGGAFHQICVMHNEYLCSGTGFVCPGCLSPPDAVSTHPTSTDTSLASEMYTFVSGSELPVKLVDYADGNASLPGQQGAETLPESDVSAFMERKVRDRMKADDCPNAERTVSVRVISDCARYFKVPDVVRKHFRMEGAGASLPAKVSYRSKAVALFQKIDGLDVCIFCMYVQEYDGDEDYEGPVPDGARQKKRVYIAYLDSVEHFRPRPHRTSVYHEMLVSYLATARKRGFETAHIWACPPSKGNSFVFWNHPSSQRTPNRERLVAWYHEALSRAVDSGVVTDVKSLYESYFQHQLDSLSESEADASPSQLVCPPLLDGDFWIEEAVRIHSVNMSRYLRAKVGETETNACVDGLLDERCPARQVATLIRDRIIANPLSAPFRRPVNAAAMKLKDYHTVITKPMDLGTVYARCMLGEYSTLGDLVSDVKLVFENAKVYNPQGHFVHTKAVEVGDLFFAELDGLVSAWIGETKDPLGSGWKSAAGTSLSLDTRLEGPGSLYKDNERTSCSSPLGTHDVRSSLSKPTQAVDLLNGGAEAVHHNMVGNDTWLLEKTSSDPKACASGRKEGAQRGEGSIEDSDPVSKRRRQCWLGLEVGASVRKMRTFFFTCSLKPKSCLSEEEGHKLQAFDSYAMDFSDGSLRCNVPPKSKIADMRHALLEFSQYRNLEFDTLRRAKYSTAILLYHLHTNSDAGVFPTCTSCHSLIKEVRWHKVSKVMERRRGAMFSRAVDNRTFHPEELCSACHASNPQRQLFIPLPVSLASD